MVSRIQVDYDDGDVSGNMMFAATICSALDRADLSIPHMRRGENALRTVCVHIRDTLDFKGCHVVHAGHFAPSIGRIQQGSVIFFKPNN